MSRAVRFTSLAELHAWAHRTTPRPTPKLDHVPTAEDVFGILLHDAGIPYTRQFPFHPRRQYRADFFIAPWLLLEVDGNGRHGHPGAHRSIKGYEDDRERDADALALGYIVLRVTPRQVMNGKALAWVQRLLTKTTAGRI